MEHKDTVTPRQLAAAGFVSVLAPYIRRFPRLPAALAGGSAWCAVPMAALLCVPVLLGAWRLFRRHAGLSEALCAVWGAFPGRVLQLCYALWLLCYAGFLLRSGAERFLSTVYPGAHPAVFVLGMALLCIPAAAGSLRAVCRSAMLFYPLLAGLLVLVGLLSVGDFDLSLLALPGRDTLAANGFAALETVNVLSVAGYLSFFGDRVQARFRRRDVLPGLAGLLAAAAEMTVCCIAVFGPALTGSMTFPFFLLTRELSALGSLERMEPPVIALWVLSDFVLISLLLKLVRELGEAALALPEGRPLRSLPLAAAAALLALAIPGDAAAFARLSELLVPAANAVMALGIPALTLLVGLLLRRV